MRSMRLIALLALPAHIALAQNAQVTVSHLDSLTVDQAIDIARTNNPAFQQTKDQVRIADAQVHTAYGALLPSAGANFAGGYTQGGNQVVQGLQFANAYDTYNARYSIGLNYNISAAAAFAPRAARANRRASEANVVSSSEALRSSVTTQYIQALESQATAALNDTLVLTAQGQLDLANAKQKVGAGTVLEVRTAEVALGQAEVNALQAHNQATIEKLKLFQLLGVEPDTAVRLTTRFTVMAEPPASLDSLLTLARRVNPDLAAKKSIEYANSMQVKVAKTQYLPTLSISTGIGGSSFGTSQNSDLIVAGQVRSLAGQYASCLSADSLRAGAGLAPRGNCQDQQLTAGQIQAIRDANDPMHFRSAPLSVQASLSLPIFNNFQRESQIEQARVQHDDAVYNLKARNIQLTNDVTTAYVNLIAAAKTIELQEKTAQQATEALAFAQESYKVGAKTFLDVTTARGTYEQALIARVNAIYEYHKAFAALEGAVGRPLR